MRFVSALFIIILFSGFSSKAQLNNDLYKTVVQLDSAFFHAYNTCDMGAQEAFYDNAIEFFHDRSGLDTSKAHVLENTKKYICGKVERRLVRGSIEVSPLPGYGAVELGQHSFYNNVEKVESKPSKFVIIWKNTNGKWTITKVISLHEG